MGNALYDAWGHIEATGAMMAAALDRFARRWGGFDAEAFQRALGGEKDDRLFALFACGYLGSSSMTEVIIPFLASPLSKERWASTITLGRWKQEEILPSLLLLLQEGLVFTPPIDLHVLQEEEHLRWEREVITYGQEYDWYRLQRQQVALILASWRHPSVIPALIQAFDACYHQELHSQAVQTRLFLARDLQTFQDCLAYALGQQKAWDAPDRLGLPPERLHILRMFMAYGVLHTKTMFVVTGFWYYPYNERGISKPEQIDAILQEHFHLSPEACSTFHQEFLQYCTTRENQGAFDPFL